MKTKFEEFAKTSDLPRYASLDATKFGYWVAASINDTRPVSVKSYYDGKCHGGISGGDLLDTLCEVNEFSGPEFRKLSRFAHAQEALPEPELLGSVVQLRAVRYPSSTPQGKMYFRPVRRGDLGIRRAVWAVSALVKEALGEEKAKSVRAELLRRDAVYPTFYIAIAFRPNLEIETYHDIQDKGAAPWDSEAVRALAEDLTGSTSAADRSARITAAASAHGFACRHVSCDLVGGDQAISLFFDHPNWQMTKNQDYQDLLEDISGLEGSSSGMPEGKNAFRICEEMCPIMIGTKVSCSPSAPFMAIIEEIDLSIGDLI